MIGAVLGWPPAGQIVDVFDYLPKPLRDVATAQAGVISRADATARGVSDAVIRRAVQRGTWRRIHPRVYSVSPTPLTREGLLWAALLYAGLGATLSHETAAEVWGLDEPRGQIVHVTIPVTRRVRSVSTVRIHYAHRLSTSRHPTRIPPVTRIEDTVLDLIDRARDVDEVVMWLTRSCQRRLTTPERLGLSLEARKKIRWRGDVESILSDVAHGAESALELSYLKRVERAHELPRGSRQRRRRVGGRVRYSDVEYEEFDVIVELDGKVGHIEEAVFRDHRRDNAAARQGRITLRYGWADTTRRACAIAVEVAIVLRQRGWVGSPRPCGPRCVIMNSS